MHQFPNDRKSNEIFKITDDLLFGRRRTVWGIAKSLKKALGLIGSLLIVYSAMLATSAGMGAIYALIVWAMGIPILNVFGAALGGVVLIIIAFKKFDLMNSYSAVIKLLYQLLDPKRLEKS
jgi:hypothetical protein